METSRRTSTQSDAIRRLRSLASNPQAQAEYACTLLAPRTRRDELMAALEAVASTPVPDARPRLLDLYDHFAAQEGKRDRGAYVRSALLKALRPLVEPGDRDLLLAAVTTYEYLPPAFDDAAGPLRAAGLIALSDVDDELGRYHAVRLLADRENTAKMSGEPAVTAAQVLGVQHELTPLFLYAMGPAHPDCSEVMAECLHQLTAMPSAMVPSLIERHGESDNAIVLLGLFDLLLGHEDGPQGLDFIADFLAATRREDVYRYLVTTLVASGSPGLLEIVLASARFERDREKMAILARALALVEGDPAVDEVLTMINQSK